MTAGRRIREDEKLLAWIRAGRPFRPWDEQPRLTEADAWLREAWIELDTCRPQGMAGVGRIPWTAVEAYAEAQGVADKERFHAVIRSMDNAYIEAMSERIEHDRTTDEPRGKGARRGPKTRH